MDLGLEGVHVLITGASGGIGLETARLFLKHGARVTAQYNTTFSTLEPLIHEYGGDRLQKIQADLTQESSVRNLFEQIRHVRPVQALVVSQGIWPTEHAPVISMSLARWQTTITTNLTASFLVVREYLKQLEQRATDEEKTKASIVMIGSASGKVGEAGHADYASTKSAMMYGLTLSLKNEIVAIAPRGRVNTVAPGWVITPMAAEAMQDRDVVYQSLATMSLKKFATPTDVANQIVIASSSTVSGHLTGEVILLTGGMEGRLLHSPEDVAAYDPSTNALNVY